MDIDFEKVIEDVRVVDSERDYWFVRTFSGELYNSFLEGNYVGLGFNNVPYKYITEATQNKSNYKRLRDFIENNTDYKKGEATKWANQLVAFEEQVKVGDIVIVPSKNSDELSFGIVENQTYLVDSPGTFQFKDKYESYPEKRKTVKWIKKSSREELGSEMRGLISTHQGLTNAGWYSQYIEGNLSAVYIKEDKVYLSIKINQDEEINAFELAKFLDSFTFFYKELCEQTGEAFEEDLFIKIKLQSRGKMLFNGACKLAGIALVGMLVLSSGAEFEADFLVFKLKGSTGEGLLHSLSKFKDAELERQIKYHNLVESQKALKVNEPDSIVEETIEVPEVGVASDSTKNLN